MGKRERIRGKKHNYKNVNYSLPNMKIKLQSQHRGLVVRNSIQKAADLAVNDVYDSGSQTGSFKSAKQIKEVLQNKRLVYIL